MAKRVLLDPASAPVPNHKSQNLPFQIAKVTPDRRFSNYPEFKFYLNCSNSIPVNMGVLLKILDARKKTIPGNASFRMLDIGSSDGELTFALLDELKGEYSGVRVVCLEPEKQAFLNLTKRANSFPEVEALNSPIHEFLSLPNAGLFDLILSSHSWYHFPKEKWEFLVKNLSSLLNPGGQLVILMDSSKGVAYTLRDLVTQGVPDTLEFGNLYCVEELEHSLLHMEITPIAVPYSLHLQFEEDGALESLARVLGFLYRKHPSELTQNFSPQLYHILEENRHGNGYVIENLTKALVISN